VNVRRSKSLINSSLFQLLLLILVGVFVYGVYIPGMGFYWDDWPWIWLANLEGPEGLLLIDQFHRPFAGYILYFGYLISGNDPQGWQIYNLILRVLGAFSMGWFLRQLWPKNTAGSICVSLFFLLYPGFTQQFVSINSSRHLAPLITYFLSLGWMVKAITNQEGYWYETLASLIFSLITMLSTEYYYGLELLRPVIIGLLFFRESEPNPIIIRTIFFRWLPYLGSVLIIFSWRYSVSQRNINYSITFIDGLLNFPGITLVNWAKDALVDLFEAGIFSWLQVFRVADHTLYYPETNSTYYLFTFLFVTGTSVVLFLLGGDSKLRITNKSILKINLFSIFVCLFLFLVEQLTPVQLIRGFPMLWQMVLLIGVSLGIILFSQMGKGQFKNLINRGQRFSEIMTLAICALIIAPLPFWLTSLDPKVEFAGDRLTLPMMFGSSLLLYYLIANLRKSMFKIFIFSAVVGLAVGFHSRNATSYRQDWTNQIDFLQQLQTRAPGLKENTALLTHELKSTRSTDNSLTAPINWMYFPSLEQETLPLALFNIKLRFGKDPISLERDTNISSTYLGYTFNGSGNDALVFYYQPPACLRFVEPKTLDKQIIPPFIPEVREALPLSSPGQVITDASPSLIEPLEDIPIINEWCQVFQKAELARQQQNWVEITNLGNEYLEKYSPLDVPSEYLPFVEGFARAGEIEKGVALTSQVLEEEKNFAPALCLTWENIEDNMDASEDVQRSINYVYHMLGGCY
jgi:hypothetical protein